MAEKYFTALAEQLFKGVVDKGGNPYIEHLREVASYQNSPYKRLLAMHHDSIEDGKITAKELLKLGAPESFVARLELLAKPAGMKYFDYVETLMVCPDLIEVKKGDLRSNMNVSRLKVLTDMDWDRVRKYHHAYRMLCDAA